MKHPDIHLAVLETHLCESLTKDLKALLELLSADPPNDLLLDREQRNELSNNGLIFLDAIRDKLNGIRALLAAEADERLQP